LKPDAFKLGVETRRVQAQGSAAFSLYSPYCSLWHEQLALDVGEMVASVVQGRLFVRLFA
jgi:hypothetical protein